MNVWAQKQKGFTIVELLIVVVVIAILAAITIVAYNGIQNRAKNSALQTTVAQAGKKALAYKPVNNDLFPQEASYRTDLDIPTDTDQATYDYYTSNDRRSFCLSSTNTSTTPATSYAYTQNGKTVQGRCVENLVTNPSFETNTNGWSYNTTGLQGGATGGVSNPSGGYTGDKSLRYAFSSGGAMVNFGTYTLVQNLNATTAYSLSVWVKSNKPMMYTIWAERRNSANTILGNISSSPVTLTPDVWTPIKVNIPVTANLDRLTFCIYGAFPSVAIGDYIEWDGAMLKEGVDTVYYNQGPDTDWIWVGAAGSSALIGPASAL